MSPQLRHRINAGKVAVSNQISFFREHFARVESEWKADHSRVTFADFAISEKIGAELRESFPEDDFCSEENATSEARKLESRYCWLLDPIDGTNNYALGIHVCAISLGLLKDGVPVYGIIYDFSRDVIVHGGPDLGLYEGNSKCRVDWETPLTPQSIIGVHFPLKPAQLEWVSPLLLKYRVRSVGSGTLNLAYIANGLLQGGVDHKVRAWDIAAAHALVLGSGGQIRYLEEDPFPLKEFSDQLPRCPYAAGSAAFLEELALSTPA